MKNIDSSKNVKECVQVKCGEKWNLTDIEAREGFTRSTESKLKFSAGLNMHGERIK